MNNIARGILTVILCVVLVGFGVCGTFGTFGGLAGLSDRSAEGRGIGQLMLGCGLVGLAIACVSCWVLVRLWRKRPRTGE